MLGASHQNQQPFALLKAKRAANQSTSGERGDVRWDLARLLKTDGQSAIGRG